MPGRADLGPSIRPTGTGSTSSTTPTTPTPVTPSLPSLPGGGADLDLDVLLAHALVGQLSGPEVEALSKLLQSPEGNDKFTPQQKADLQRFVQGNEPLPRAPSELHGDLSKVKDVEELPERFAGDLALVRDALVDHKALLRAEKATRMFDFVVPYAQALVQLAATPAQQRAVAAQLVLAAEDAGYKQLQRQPDGKDGLAALAELLRAKTPEEVAKLAQGQKFDAPVWPKDAARQGDPHHPADREVPQQNQVKMGDPQAPVFKPVPPIMQPPVPIGQRVVQPGESAQSQNGTHQRLGPMMLWNALHRLRDAGEDGQDSAAQREAMTQLAWAAGLILVFAAVVVVVLVAI